MKQQLTITLDWPYKAMQPNTRCHWAIKAKAVSEAREIACLTAQAESRRAKWKRVKTASIEFVFFDPVKRRRDRDNHLAACKAYIDGFADAGLIDDDSGFVYLPVRFEVGSPRRVEARITA